MNMSMNGGRWRSWLPRVALLSLVAVAATQSGPSTVAPRLELAATESALTTSAWSPRPPLRVARIGLDVATVAGDVLAIGGFDPAEPDVFASVEARRLDGNPPWRTVPAMPTGRANAAAAELNGAVYVAGGFSNEDTLDVVERFDPLTASWSTSTRLPAPRGAAAAASLDGLLYVAGGLVPAGKDEEITASVVAFNPRTRVWLPVAPMPTPRWRLRLVATAGSLYAIGGQSPDGNTLSTVERYDPRFNRWTAVAPMTEDRGVPGVVAVNHGLERLIVVVGGCQFADGQLLNLLPTTEVYNVNTNQWRQLKVQLPHGTCSLGAATEADGTVLAIAGGIRVDGAVTATAEVSALTM